MRAAAEAQMTLSPANFLKLIWWNIKHFSLTISSLFTISLSCLTSVQRLHCSPSQFKHILLFHISYHCILHVKMTVIARCCYLWYNFLASSHGCLRIWIFFFFVFLFFFFIACSFSYGANRDNRLHDPCPLSIFFFFF